MIPKQVNAGNFAVRGPQKHSSRSQISSLVTAAPSMLDYIIAPVIFLNLTASYGVLAAQLGISIQTVTAGCIAGCILYVTINWEHAMHALQGRTLVWLFMLVAGWPLFTLLWNSNSIDGRETYLTAYGGLLILTGALWARRTGWTSTISIITAALAISIFGIFWSLLDPAFFSAALDLSQSHQNYRGRAFGFFGQPNDAAMVLVFLAIFSLSPRNQNLQRRDHAILISAFAAILLTGSRGGLVAAIGAMGWVVLSSKSGVRSRVTLLAKGTVTIGALAGTLAVAAPILNAELGFENPMQRLADTVEGNLSEIGITDGSVSLRQQAINARLDGIRTQPLLGHGLRSSNLSVSQNRMSLASHNTYLDLAYDYGIPFLMLFLYFAWSVFRSAERAALWTTFGRDIVGAILIAAALSSLINNSLLNSRAILLMLGAMAALIDIAHQRRSVAQRT